MDLLATALTGHEKNLSNLISRLEDVSKKMSESGKDEKPEKASKREGHDETLIFIKLKISRPPEDLKMILDSLKG